MLVFIHALSKSLTRRYSVMVLSLGIAFCTQITLAEIDPKDIEQRQLTGDEEPMEYVIEPPEPGTASGDIAFCETSYSNPILKIFVPPYDNEESDGWDKKYRTMVYFPGLPHTTPNGALERYENMAAEIASGGTVVALVDYSEEFTSEDLAEDLINSAAIQWSGRSAFQSAMEGRCAIRWVKQLADLESEFYPMDIDNISVGAHSWGTLMAQNIAIANDGPAQKEVDGVLIDLIEVTDDDGNPLLKEPDSDPLLRSKFFYAMLPALETYYYPEVVHGQEDEGADYPLGTVNVNNGVRTIKLSVYEALLVEEDMVSDTVINHDELPAHFESFGQWEQKWRAKSDTEQFHYTSEVKSMVLGSTGDTLGVLSNCAVLNSHSMTEDLSAVTVPIPMVDGAPMCGPYTETKTVTYDMNYFIVDQVPWHRDLMDQIASDLTHTGGRSIFKDLGFVESNPEDQIITPHHFSLSPATRAKAETWDWLTYLDLAGPKIPILVLNGEKDEWTQWTEAAQLASALKQSGHPVEMVRFPNAEHTLYDHYRTVSSESINLFLDMVQNDEISSASNSFNFSVCYEQADDGTNKYQCLNEITTNGKVVVGMPRTSAQMSSEESWATNANPYLIDCGETNASCKSNYPLYKGLSYQLDGLAFTEDFADKGEQLAWTLTPRATNTSLPVDLFEEDDMCLADVCGRSLKLDLTTANLAPGTYDLIIEVKDGSIPGLTAEIEVADHPMHLNNTSSGFNGYYKLYQFWFIKWTQVYWRRLSWSQGVAKTGGWVTAYRDGAVASTRNKVGVFSYMWHQPSAIHEVCLSDTTVCSGPLPLLD